MKMLQQQPVVPAAPAAPAAPGATGTGTPRITIDGAPVAASAYDIYQAFRAQRRVLGDQLDNLQSQRADLSRELVQEGVTGADRKGIEQRITTIDERIASLDKQIAEADAQVAKAAAVPGAAVEPPQPPRSGPPEEAFVVGTIFIFVFFLPLSIAMARRIWRRSAKIVTTIPKELTERIARVEQTVEATAIEIERIGEGQRFITRIFTETQSPHALHAAPAQPSIPSGRPGDVRP
jgi:hypothetical protein